MATHRAYQSKYRYSEIRALHENLEKVFTNLPKFPGKKIFGITNDDIKDIKRRSVQL
jgi:hypothetical protein